MSIYHKEVLRVDGSLKAYIVVQNDWSGATIGGLRDIHLEGDTYYARADGNRVNVTKDRERYLRHEDEVKTALEWYHKTKF